VLVEGEQRLLRLMQSQEAELRVVQHLLAQQQFSLQQQQQQEDWQVGKPLAVGGMCCCAGLQEPGCVFRARLLSGTLVACSRPSTLRCLRSVGA
jgi:hypothetical protein